MTHRSLTDFRFLCGFASVSHRLFMYVNLTPQTPT
jgi:hypothetical protein